MITDKSVKDEEHEKWLLREWLKVVQERDELVKKEELLRVESEIMKCVVFCYFSVACIASDPLFVVVVCLFSVESLPQRALSKVHSAQDLGPQIPVAELCDLLRCMKGVR